MAVESAQAGAPQTAAGTSSGQATSQSDTPQALKTWWAGFKHKRKKEDPRAEPASAPPPPGIFGIPLADSIKYANVAISLINDEGESFIYGYVPIVVAKCGVFLKEKATDVEGIFRLSGSAKRIKELQTAFDSPDRYGKGLDWTGYTVHDAANVLRRYLNNLPQPIVPLEFYDRFREPLRNHFNHSGTDGTVTGADKNFDHDKAITTYQQLITEIPPLNRQLLLYILDLLAVFASKSDVNLMTSANLAAIFQPGVLSHPTHDMSPEAYRLSQDVLIFLIDNQDSFLIGMSGTAADEKTVREVQSGALPKQPSTPSKTGLGRSSSNASNPGEGKRYSGVRRNQSVSSRNSRHSSQGPATPLSSHFSGSAVHRSNTVPSKKSPAIPTARFNRGLDSPSTPLALSPAIGGPTNRAPAFTEDDRKTPDATNPAAPVEGLGLSDVSAPGATNVTETKDASVVPADSAAVAPSSSLLTPPVRSRKVSDVLMNLTGGADRDGRQPNKLKKKRLPSNLSASGNSSNTSLVGGEQSPGFPPSKSPLRTPDITALDRPDPLATAPVVVNSADLTPTNDPEPKTPTAPTNAAEALSTEPESSEKLKAPQRPERTQNPSEATLRARSGSRNSTHSKSSVTDLSELDHDQTEEARAEHKEKKRRWRFSHSAKKSKSPARVGSNAGAEQSSSSVGSWHRSRKSTSNETNPSQFEPVPSLPGTTTTITSGGSKARSRSRDASGEKQRDGTEEEKEEKMGFFDKLKKKVNQAKDKKERDAEKERAKSPGRDAERSSSKHSLSAIAAESTSPRRPSVAQQTIPEQSEIEAASAVPAPTSVAETAKSKGTEQLKAEQGAEAAPQPTNAVPAVVAASAPAAITPAIPAATSTEHDTRTEVATTTDTETSKPSEPQVQSELPEKNLQALTEPSQTTDTIPSAAQVPEKTEDIARETSTTLSAKETS